MGTLDQGIGSHTDRQIQLCEALGLDAAEITGVTVELVPLSHTVVRWSGVRRLTPEQFARLLDVFEGAGGPAVSDDCGHPNHGADDHDCTHFLPPSRTSGEPPC